MDSAIDELLAHAAEKERHFTGPRAVIPALHVAVVTCMDSRIDTFRIFGLESGQAQSCATPAASSPKTCCARSCSPNGCCKRAK